MRKLAIAVVVLMFLSLGAIPAAFADNVQDAQININGTQIAGAPIVSGGGVDASGFSNTTGLGTITITVLGGSCSGGCNVDAWLFDPASVVDFNEYGQTGGTLASGQSWQIDVPDYDSSGCPGVSCLDPNHPNTTILTNTMGNTLNDKNGVPGTVDNFSGTCSGATCNDIVSMALGFNFGDPGAGNEEVVTLDVSTTSCMSDANSICLEDTHPPDPGAAGNSYFFSGTAVSQAVCTGPNCGQPPPGLPEPGTLLMLGSSLMGLLSLRKKLSAN